MGSNITMIGTVLASLAGVAACICAFRGSASSAALPLVALSGAVGALSFFLALKTEGAFVLAGMQPASAEVVLMAWLSESVLALLPGCGAAVIVSGSAAIRAFRPSRAMPQ